MTHARFVVCAQPACKGRHAHITLPDGSQFPEIATKPQMCAVVQWLLEESLIDTQDAQRLLNAIAASALSDTNETSEEFEKALVVSIGEHKNEPIAEMLTEMLDFIRGDTEEIEIELETDLEPQMMFGHPVITWASQ